VKQVVALLRRVLVPLLAVVTALLFGGIVIILTDFANLQKLGTDPVGAISGAVQGVLAAASESDLLVVGLTDEEIEKRVYEVEGPGDEADRVDYGERPEVEDQHEAGDHVGPIDPLALADHLLRLDCEGGERQSLDHRNQQEFDVDDCPVEFSPRHL